MDFGIIGNCQYSALIDRHASVVWMCWPRFDSSFVFGSLMDTKHGGEFSVRPAASDVLGEQEYLLNTNILRTVFRSDHGDFEVIDFAPRYRRDGYYTKPNSLMRIIRPLAGEPLVRVVCKPTYKYGEENFAKTFHADRLAFKTANETLTLNTDISLNMIAEERPFVLTKPHYLLLNWGHDSVHNLASHCETALQRTKEYWETWVKHCHLPSRYQAEVIRSALVLKLHQFEDTGAVTAATTTSIPEAKGTDRCWDYRFCWLRDAHFALTAFRRLGHFEELEGFVNYLRTISHVSNERLQPVYGLSGETNLHENILKHLKGYRGEHIVRVGNQAHEHIQHDVYGEMVLAIAPLFLDTRFAANATPPPRMMLRHLLERIEGYLYAEDAGLWEFRDRPSVHTFTLLMHWAGARKAVEIATRCGFAEQKDLAVRLEKESRKFIEVYCWSDKIGAYTQAKSSNDLDASMLLLITLGFIDPASARAKRHVETLAKGLEINNSLIRRYAHLDDFGETNNAFTVCSFWLAEAYARIGEKQKAHDLFQKLLSCGNHLGLYSEDIDANTLEQWGNFPQVYSHVGLIHTAFLLSDPWE